MTSKKQILRIVSYSVICLSVVLIVAGCNITHKKILDITYPNAVAEKADISPEYKDTAQDLSNTAVDLFINEISKIPRPSLKEDKIREYLINWGKNLGLNPIQDQSGCLYIDVPATPGMENKPKLMLQSHMDMVCNTKDESINMDITSPDVVMDENTGVISSRDEKTTIGADDGEGLITIMSLVQNKNVKHGPLRLLFTADEEINMSGANTLTPSVIDCNYAINVDDSYVGNVCCSSAGGMVSTLTKNYQLQTVADKKVVDINVSDLSGGHSAADIDKGHASAIFVCRDVLNKLVDNNIEFYLINFNGGEFVNTICEKCNTKIAISEKDFAKVEELATDVFNDTKNNYKKDKNANYGVSLSSDNAINAYSIKDTKEILEILNMTKFGVEKMSQEYSNIPAVSKNIGKVQVSGGSALIVSVIRSSEQDPIDKMSTRFKMKSAEISATYEEQKTAHCWPENKDSKLLNIMMDAYENACHFEGISYATHGGLECATFLAYNPNLNIISIGADVQNEHAVTEKLYTKSLPAHFASIMYVLENIN